MTAPQKQLWWAPYVLPVTAPPARDVLITIENGCITKLEPKVSRESAQVLPNVTLHDNCVIAPGFVNTHAHLEYAAYDALVDGLGFVGWIQDHMRRKRRLTDEHRRASAMLGAFEALYAGITTVGDASFSADSAYAMQEAGLRGRVYLEVFGGLDEHSANEATQACLDRLAALPSSNLIEHGISPHAPYTVGEPLYRAVSATGLPWMTHFLESRAEVDYLYGRGNLYETMTTHGMVAPDWQGQSPILALEDVLGPHVVATHLVQASSSEIEVLAATGTAAAHCPRSNARLGCGVFNLGRADRAGVLIGLGTDSPTSAGPIDPFAEIRSALELHRAVSTDPAWPDLGHLHRLFTLDAARALGYENIGALDVGMRADLIAVHVGRCDDPRVAMLLGAGPNDVRAVMIDGIDAGVHDRNALQVAREQARDVRELLSLPTRSISVYA